MCHDSPASFQPRANISWLDRSHATGPPFVIPVFIEVTATLHHIYKHTQRNRLQPGPERGESAAVWAAGSESGSRTWLKVAVWIQDGDETHKSVCCWRKEQLRLGRSQKTAFLYRFILRVVKERLKNLGASSVQPLKESHAWTKTGFLKVVKHKARKKKTRIFSKLNKINRKRCWCLNTNAGF